MLSVVRLVSPLVLIACGAVGPAGAATAAHLPIHAPRHTLGRGTSTNWSGYDVTGSGATHVIGSWTQPSVTCGPGENSWSSPWVGIDGDTSNTVEQTGTDSDCSSGTPTYYAWYEMYPKGTVQIPMTVTPGDSFTGEVTYSAGNFTLRLTDNTTKKSFSTTIADKHAHEASVEWIMEGPSNGELSDFKSVTFTGTNATINGVTGSLYSFTNADPITMVTSSNTPRATPSSVSSNGSFSVTWDHS
ncbi:MAG TPA: G1 family glutamic endopeptidase [Chloroflexota bacterium]|nr:G1 family glutamic endopeptidase [Chloroflexota bacterium]